jgi:3alpha(or 20beta)-hydroxysteroid dehydrogenase
MEREVSRKGRSAYRFEDKVVLITGAARGMGAAHGRAFHEEGAKVVLTDVLDEGRQVAEELGDRAIFLPLDITDAEAWASVVDTAEQAFGPLSVLVNNAAIIFGNINIEDFDVALWRRVIDVNLTGQFLGIRAVVPSLRRSGGGAIVNITSTAGFRAVPSRSAYCASKFGLRGLTQSAALELGRDNIRVNAVAPGVTLTPMQIGHPTAAYAIARMADPSEISRLVLYLASDESSFSTGSTFEADGGYLSGQALSYS